MPKGNPNPSPETRFGAVNGNPSAGGKTSEQRKAEYAAAEKAALLRDRMISVIMEKTEGDDDALLSLLDANTLKLFKDSEDRAHGTPKQYVESENKHDVSDPFKQLIEEINSDRGGS